MLLNVKFKILERWQFSFDLQQIEENMDRFKGLQIWKGWEGVGNGGAQSA